MYAVRDDVQERLGTVNVGMEVRSLLPISNLSPPPAHSFRLENIYGRSLLVILNPSF